MSFASCREATSGGIREFVLAAQRSLKMTGKITTDSVLHEVRRARLRRASSLRETITLSEAAFVLCTDRPKVRALVEEGSISGELDYDEARERAVWRIDRDEVVEVGEARVAREDARIAGRRLEGRRFAEWMKR